MMGLQIGTALWLSVAATATMQAPARSIQQDFEAAAALDAAPDAAAALAAWQALERRTTSGSRNRAIVTVRKGDALFRLHRLDEASAALQAGLGALPVGDASLRDDRARASLLLGALAREVLDYAGAARWFAQAEELSGEPAGKLSAATSLAQVQVFVDPGAAARTLARIDALATTLTLDSDSKALIARRHAGLMMNIGDTAGARTQATYAVTALGGLTSQTTWNDVAARSDAALAYLLAGNRDRARE